MRALDFSIRYDCKKPRPATDLKLAEEGFLQYNPGSRAMNRIWAMRLTTEQIETSFPASQFIASWGAPVSAAIVRGMQLFSRY